MGKTRDVVEASTSASAPTTWTAPSRASRPNALRSDCLGRSTTRRTTPLPLR
jgi:hypothetical protein